MLILDQVAGTSVTFLFVQGSLHQHFFQLKLHLTHNHGRQRSMVCLSHCRRLGEACSREMCYVSCRLQECPVYSYWAYFGCKLEGSQPQSQRFA